MIIIFSSVALFFVVIGLSEISFNLFRTGNSVGAFSLLKMALILLLKRFSLILVMSAGFVWFFLSQKRDRSFLSFFILFFVVFISLFAVYQFAPVSHFSIPISEDSKIVDYSESNIHYDYSVLESINSRPLSIDAVILYSEKVKSFFLLYKSYGWFLLFLFTFSFVLFSTSLWGICSLTQWSILNLFIALFSFLFYMYLFLKISGVFLERVKAFDFVQSYEIWILPGLLLLFSLVFYIISFSLGREGEENAG